MLTILWIAGRIMGGWYGRFQYIVNDYKKIRNFKIISLVKI